ncbi:hypothetical protein CMV_014274 [Castanea mollissima]|uniref:Uncharacterized protein n=1 Tax=Castanea mollissima TaxID=60419 RepID=A0A8J4VL51_9ROSI|nr:hypothetical protein CMV_014274 [Castanea mollissima]
MHAIWHEGTEKRTTTEGTAKMTLGSGSQKNTEGKRKAHDGLVYVGESSKECSGLRGERGNVESPNKLGLFQEGTNKSYEGPLSIRGKKVLARLRAAPANSRSADSREGNKGRQLPKTIWSPTNEHLPLNNNGEFLFLSKSRNEMGNMLEGKGCGNPNDGDQAQAKGSMEMEFTANANSSECKIGQPSIFGPSVGSNDETMVVLPVRRTKDRGGMEANWGDRSSNRDVRCNRSGDDSLGKEKVGQIAICNQVIGQHNESYNISTKLKATPISLVARGQDRLTWGMSMHGGFELKSAYKLAIGGGEGESSFIGQWVWKTNILPPEKSKSTLGFLFEREIEDWLFYKISDQGRE